MRYSMVCAACLVAVTFGATAAWATVEPPRVAPDAVAEMVWGVYCSSPPDSTIEAPGTAAGIVNLVETLPEIAFVQQIVPATLDVGFGVLMRTPDGIVHDPVVITVRHPPYRGTEITQEQWVTTLDDLEWNLIGFSFDTHEELVLGRWSFTAQLGDDEIFHIAFDVVPPELAPAATAACGAAITS